MDAVFTEVMKHRFSAIAEEASTIAYRTAYTTYVKQTQDYQVALAALSGEFFAFPIRSGVTTLMCKNVRAVVDEIGIDKLRPGDVIISNDPFTSGGLITHIMDIHLIQPIFFDDELVCFSWSFIHATDIGGAVPGSVSRHNSEVFQEGVRLRPQFLYRRGVFNDHVWNVLKDNTRIPDLIWGDLRAMMSAQAHLEKRVGELCARYGLARFQTGVRDVLDLAEAMSRAVIRDLPDGTWSFGDYVESTDDQPDIFIHATMTIKGDELSLDFTGSDPQVPSALNFCVGDKHTSPFLCLAVINYIQTVASTIPRNSGIIRPIRGRAPTGTIMNASFPAAMGNRFVAVMRVYDAVMGCLNQAIPGGLCAGGAGQAGIVSTSIPNHRTGTRNVMTFQPFVGGSGGHRQADGIDAIDRPICFLRSTPIEAAEIEAPILVREFMLENGSSGAGRFRGGMALRVTLENLGAGTIIAARGLDRTRLQPWGAEGGRHGSTGRVVLNPGTKAERPIAVMDLIELAPGDVLHMVSPSGGGFGDPHLRDEERVLQDVLDDVIDIEEARRAYGVAISDGMIDAAETARLRVGRRQSSDEARFGSVRILLESRWPMSARLALAEALGGYAPSHRIRVRNGAFRTLSQRHGAVDAEAVRAYFAKEPLSS